MAYVVVVVSAFLAVSAATALRPSRHGLFAAFAYPVGWAAGELPGKGIAVEGILLGALWWSGWPTTTWLDVVVVALASIVAIENLALIVILFRSRTIVRRSMGDAPVQPLRVGLPTEDVFGRWWRTALQIPLHPRAMELHADIVYGPMERQRLDVWKLPTTIERAPVIYYIHGGAWTFGDKRQQGRPMLHEFVSRGWVVVAINYRLAPQFPWPAQIEDATRALGWIKTNISSYGGDPDRVVVAGGSAGGHLASLLALSSEDPAWRPDELPDASDWTVRGALSFYGVLEMFGDEEHWRGLGRALRRLLEHRVVQLPYDGNDEIYRALSPIERIRVDSPPFLVVQGTTDTLVEVNVARAFVAKFRSIAFAPLYYIELPLTQHAFDLTVSPRTSATTRAAIAFAESVAVPRPPLSSDLVRSYQVPPTSLEVCLGEQWVEARDATADAGSFFVVTSDNPYSTLLDRSDNEARRRELRATLDSRLISYHEARGRDPSGRWPDELGVALFGVMRDDARALALAWGQFAFYEVSQDGVLVRDSLSDLVLS
jgi:acetyl esterase/lipase